MQTVIAFILISASLLALYLRYFVLTHWRRRGIPHDEPDFPTGNMTGWRSTRHLMEIFKDVYNHHRGSGPFAGMYMYLKPVVVALDLDFIKNVMIKDFSNFVNRGVFNNERDDPLTGHLFAIEDEKWRVLRSKLSPTFTSGKMKYMYPTVLKVAQELVSVLNDKSLQHIGDLKSGVVEIVDLVGRYTADVIGNCAFGLDCNSLHDPKADFVVMGKKAIIARRHNRFIDSFLIEAFPSLAKKLRMCQTHPDCHEFYMRIVRDTVEYRTTNNIKRKDFMDLLLNISTTNGENSDEMKPLTLNEIAAQSFVFFVAGFDTSSTTMSFALYELANHPDMQFKAREEIKQVLEKHNNEFSYEAVNDLKYLHQIIAETLRKYPVVGVLVRQTSAHYKTSNPKYFIEKGTSVFIPVYAIHHDPTLYPDPDRFNPDRFTEVEVQRRHTCAYLPFGEGPRNCIGLRFGKMQAAIGLALLLQQFKFSVCESTKTPRFNNENILMSAADGIHLKVDYVKQPLLTDL